MHNFGTKFGAEFCDCHDSSVARHYSIWRFRRHVVGDASLNVGQTNKFEVLIRSNYFKDRNYGVRRYLNAERTEALAIMFDTWA